MPSTLGGRLVVMLALFIALVTAGVVGVQFALGRADLVREAGRRLDGEAAVLAQRLARDVRARAEAVAVWSQLEAAQDVVTDDIDKRLATTLDRLVSSLGAGDFGVALDETGRVVAVSPRALPAAAVAALPAAVRSCTTGDSTTISTTGADTGPLLVMRHGIVARADGRNIGCLLLVTPWRSLVAGVAPAPELERMEVRRDGAVVWPSALATRGISLISGAARVDESGMRLDVDIAQARADALRPVRQRGLAALLLAIAVLAAALPAAYVSAHSTAEPLRALTASAMALRDEEPTGLAVPPAHAPREVQVLHGALDAMLRRLEQSRRAMLEREALASLGTMAAALAHEVRTPLAVLQSSAQLLDREQPPARRHELSSMVLAEVARLDRLVTDLLAFARPRAPELTDGDLSDVVRRAAPLLDPLCDRCTVALQLDLQPAPARLDDEQLRQVVLNLASNAVQFSRAGSAVRISTATDDGEAILTIADDGAGIEAARLSEIFTPFHSTRRGGTGLGLAIVRRIVERHGGAIHITSTAGAGTTARVVLPLSQRHG